MPCHHTRLVAPLTILAFTTLAVGQSPTPKRPITDTYHAVEVIDNYRWLENPDDPEVKAWSDAQNVAARKVLDALPNRAAISARVEQIMTAPTVRFSSLHAAGDRLLAMRMEPSRQQPVLVAFDDLKAVTSGEASTTPRIVLDPAIFDPSHKTTIDWYVPSPDGTLVAISLSSSGTESGDVHIFTVADGKPVHEVVPRAQGGTAGGSLAWMPDSKGFYYTRYPRAGERPEEDMDFYVQVFHHTLGETTEKDRYELGAKRPRACIFDDTKLVMNADADPLEAHLEKQILQMVMTDKHGDARRAALRAFEFPRVAEIDLHSDKLGRVLAIVQDGDGGYFSVYLRDAEGYWSTIARYPDRVVQAVFGPDDAVYMVSRKDAPRGKLLRLSIAAADIEHGADLKKAKVVVPESTDTLVSEFFEASNLVVTDSLVYATYQLGGPSEVRVFSHEGKQCSKPAQPPVASAGGLTNLNGNSILFSISSFIQPATWYLADPDTVLLADPDPPMSTDKLNALSTTSAVDFSPYEAVREMATSKDGTKVPVNIVRKKSLTLDGSHPTLVTGYGGYGVNIEPYFSAADIVLLEQGFVLATANIRGGGEFGDAWHRGGNLENKQNVFDDFAAACKHMIDAKYTNPSKLAIEGGSNGGLLMGAMLTQHPDMFKSVVSHVGIYDMLRVELSSNGAFNIPEFGTVKEEKLFKAMHAYSPYHRVKDNTAYPATLFLTGANDPRVDPMQSRKMTARLQVATSASSAAPILLRTSGDTGHGAGTPLKERIAQNVDVDAFLFDRLGINYKPAAK